MLRRINGLDAAIEAFNNRTPASDEEVLATDGGGVYGEVLGIEAFADRVIADVREQGDKFLKRITKALEGVEIEDFKVPADVTKASKDELRSNEVDALELAAERVAGFQRRTLPHSWRDVDAGYGEVVHPVQRVGCCIPGGTAPLASTVIMTAVPARVAGVPYVCVVTPAGKGGLPHPAVLAACDIAGVDDVFTVGGAQAVAALAVGTESIPKVDVVCGPGSAWVTAAKRRVYGIVGVDGIYGPTETMVIVSEDSDPEVAAADMLAQAEHDVIAAPVLVALSDAIVDAVESELAMQLEMLPRAQIAREALMGRGAAVVVDTLEDALKVAEVYAPEHLCLGFDDAHELLENARHAGGIFIGERSGEVMADYVAGPSHVMPTGGSARFSSALSARDFVRVTPFLDMDAETFESIAVAASDLARLEMLEGHAHAADIRRGR